MSAITFATPLGPVQGRLFGSAAPPFAVCINGKSANTDVVHEWEKTAAALVGAGFTVIIPDLHSNPDTKPGVIAISDAVAVIGAVLDHQGITVPVALMGKSWGGGVVTRFAAEQPHRISKLVLVAPSLAPSLEERKAVVASLSTSTIPVCLLWADDDPVVPVDKADAYKEVLDAGRLTFTTTPTGGHRVLDEYIESIVSWARS